MQIENGKSPVELSPAAAPLKQHANGYGFPRAAVVSGIPVVRPTPIPKRPKGRWFIAGLLLLICSYAVYQVWQAFFRYEAFGIVTAHVILVSPPWDGAVVALHVQDGQRVRQGDLLATVENTELRQRYAQLGDELRVAQANLEAETAKLKWQAAFNLDHGPGAVAQYYQTIGQLFQEESKLDELKSSQKRLEMLRRRNAVSQEELDQTRFNREGLERRIQQLRAAVDELKKRAAGADPILQTKQGAGGIDAGGHDQLKPCLARIEALQYERTRLHERLDQGDIRAPANGLVVKFVRLVGERCKAAEPLLRFLEEGSVRVTLYVPQASSGQFTVGGDVHVVLDPYPDKLHCTVSRVGAEFEAAPDQIKRHYPEGHKLLPIELRPDEAWEQWMALRPGGVVKLPYQWLPREVRRDAS
ncbi:MAG: HlyD family secretion protein [Candidatus Acidiferrum sp.]